MRDEWYNKASCKGSNTEAYFPLVVKKKNLPQIISCFEVCESCLVSDLCLYNACVNKEYGIWGRTTERMRSIFLSERDNTSELTVEECRSLIQYLKDNDIYPYKGIVNFQ
jgi:hypothetical protein